MSSWQWEDIEYGCQSSDPFERFNAHQAAKGRTSALDPDETLHIDGCTLPGDHPGDCDA